MINRRNLRKLAIYLEALPPDYGKFGMAMFSTTTLDIKDLITLDKNECGTCACAVGHGPAAGIAVPKELLGARSVYIDEESFETKEVCVPNWIAYSHRVFTDEDDVWTYMFGGDWKDVDDTPAGAAKRIRYILLHGKTPFYFDDINTDTWVMPTEEELE